MSLLGKAINPPLQPGAWTARADVVSADAEQLLEALTDPAAIARWAPVDFEVEGLAGGRLRAGSSERVSGTFAGVTTRFDVDVVRADREGLELTARGPVWLDVAYRFGEDVGCVTIEARVALHRRPGLGAQLLAAAVSALLNAGALGRALSQLQASLACELDAELAIAA